MSQIMIKCPKTNKDTPTGIYADEESFATSTYIDNVAVCPHCGETHVWNKEDAFLKD